MQNFQALGAQPPDPQNRPPLRISDYASATRCNVCNYMGVGTGAYLGGALGHGPPIWVARIAKLRRKVSKIEAWPPPFGNWASGFGLETPDFGRKIRRNLSEDLFFFLCSSPDFGRKMGRNLSMTISNSDLCSSQIF